MDQRLSRITQEVRRYDRRLFGFRASNGMIQILREAEKLDASDAPDEVVVSNPHPQFILALTHDWTLQGKPVEWGLEPIMTKLRSMDSWLEDKILDKMRKRREQEAEDSKRVEKNNIRAMAADVRKDFAKATNEINVASL